MITETKLTPNDIISRTLQGHIDDVTLVDISHEGNFISVSSPESFAEWIIDALQTNGYHITTNGNTGEETALQIVSDTIEQNILYAARYIIIRPGGFIKLNDPNEFARWIIGNLEEGGFKITPKEGNND